MRAEREVVAITLIKGLSTVAFSRSVLRLLLLFFENSYDITIVLPL